MAYQRPRGETSGGGVIRPPAGLDWLSKPYISDELSWVSIDPVDGATVVDTTAALANGLRFSDIPGSPGSVLVEEVV